MIEGLLLGFILNLFGFGDLAIQGVKELFGMNISIAGYYMICFILGAISDIGKITMKGFCRAQAGQIPKFFGRAIGLSLN